MKQRNYKIATALSLALLAIANNACHNTDEIAQKDDGVVLAPLAVQTMETSTSHLNETVIEQTPTNVVVQEDVVLPTAASVAPVDVFLTPPDTRLFYQDPFVVDDIPVAPWHAKYIGSYGQLPTRFQDKGPDLYSFDVSPDAAFSPDNNLGPMDFFDYGDDDDCDDDDCGDDDF